MGFWIEILPSAYFVGKKDHKRPTFFLFLVSVENIYCSTQLSFGLFVVLVHSCKTRCLVLEISLQQEIPRYIYIFDIYLEGEKNKFQIYLFWWICPPRLSNIMTFKLGVWLLLHTSKPCKEILYNCTKLEKKK